MTSIIKILLLQSCLAYCVFCRSQKIVLSEIRSILGIVLDAIILGIPQLMTSIAKLEKKFKDIERQNLIQNSL